MESYPVNRLEQEVSELRLAGAINVVHRDNVEKRLASIEDTLKWLVRLIIGGFVGATVAFIVSGGFKVG